MLLRLRLRRESARSTGAAVLERGEVVFRQSKMLLPTYDVFDEARYFRPAEREFLCTLRSRQVALTICEERGTTSVCGNDVCTSAIRLKNCSRPAAKC